MATLGCYAKMTVDEYANRVCASCKLNTSCERASPAMVKHAPTLAGTLLKRAAEIMEERGKQYDKPEGERSMAQTVDIFNRYHGLGMTEAQGWHFMQILKDVRLFQRPGYHADSAEDCIAYASLKAEAKASETDKT